MYVITAATGKIGKALSERLLGEGKQVRTLARNAQALEALEALGAESVVASSDDAAAMAPAFAGATAVFLLNPPPPLASPSPRAHQDAVSNAYVAAIEQAGVKHVVHLSSVGAHLAEGPGPIRGLHDAEQRLNALRGVNVLHLRPTFFMENFLQNIGLIRHQGINGMTLRADLPFSMIATRDIADVAAERLVALDFTGSSVHELLGQRDLTMIEATGILGRAIGKPELPYVQFPYDDARHAMVGMGISDDLATQLLDMNRGFNEGRVVPTQARSPKSTTPTSLEEFSELFARAYSGT